MMLVLGRTVMNPPEMGYGGVDQDISLPRAGHNLWPLEGAPLRTGPLLLGRSRIGTGRRSVSCAVEVVTEVCDNHLCLFLAIELIAYPGEVHVGVEDYIWGRTGATGTFLRETAPIARYLDSILGCWCWVLDAGCFRSALAKILGHLSTRAFYNGVGYSECVATRRKEHPHHHAHKNARF